LIYGAILVSFAPADDHTRDTNVRQPLVAGNWKMNGDRVMARTLTGMITGAAQSLGHTEVVLCPPFVYLPLLADWLHGGRVVLGAQSLSEHECGAWTGEVSASMLCDIGCRYVIVGHSERRQYFGEDDARVAGKFLAAQEHGLRPILCLGERLEERQAGQTEKVIARQLDAVIEQAGIATFADAVIAYEPVWAIGTGQSASPEQAQEVHAFIRGRLRESQAELAGTVRLLYGGSVKADNAASLLAMPDIDGGLIGGAALKADDFITICHCAEESARS